MPKRVAVIDDDETIRTVVGQTLAEEGYEPLLLSGAQEGAAFLRSTVPDLIFMDIHMEQREIGWSLLSLVWLQPDLAGVPVIVSSGDRQELERRRAAVQAPHCAVLEKPFDVEALLAVVSELIGPADAPASADRPA